MNNGEQPYSEAEVNQLQQSRDENEARWQHEAEWVNQERPMLHKILGKGEVTTADVMRDEAEIDDAKVDELLKIPRERPGSPYIEFNQQDGEMAQKITALEASVANEFRLIREVEARRETSGENLYRAPELRSRDFSLEQEFELRILRELKRAGKVNFWDLSVDLKKSDPTKQFDKEETLAYGQAAQRVMRELGLEEHRVPDPSVDQAAA